MSSDEKVQNSNDSSTKEAKNDELSKNFSPSKNGDRSRKRKLDDRPFQNKKEKWKAIEAKFAYGNYDRYYGKRAVEMGYSKKDDKLFPSLSEFDDPRLAHFKKEWFENKKVLDIGCNVGFITMAIAKKFSPASVVGVDIDGNLIRTANNILRKRFGDQKRNYQNNGVQADATKNKSMESEQGSSENSIMKRIRFETGNYVLAEDSLLEMVQPEYHVILALSLTKWIHLNWGDDGIKRFFQRVYLHLNPGGIFLVEPQPWNTYKKRRNLTPEISNNYNNIKFKPDRFRSYLISELGFVSYEVINQVESEGKGFARPIYLFRKAANSESSSTSQRPDEKNEGEIDGSSDAPNVMNQGKNGNSSESKVSETKGEVETSTVDW